ncbi:MAG: biotin synthase BioB [Candidatus Binatia bacterium]
MTADSCDVTVALAQAGPFRALAERSLSGQGLAPDEARSCMRAADGDLAALLWAAFAVRAHTFGRRVKLCVLNNARSGLCPEDCGYCSQSAVSTADIPRYRLKSVPELLAAAHAAAATGARRYCMVTSARGPSANDVGHFARAARAIRDALPELELCVSLGLLGDAAAAMLRDAGVDFMNHNLNTSRRYYPEICTTHSYDERLATVRSARRAGLRLCSGVIVGMGETDDDLVDVAVELGRLGPTSLPVNFLHPIDGTPLAEREPPPVGRCLRALALFRLTSPRAEIRAAGGRERCLGDAQPLALYPANSIFVEGYLTTPGQQPHAAVDMIHALGFEIDEAVEVEDAACAGHGQERAGVL